MASSLRFSFFNDIIWRWSSRTKAHDSRVWRRPWLEVVEPVPAPAQRDVFYPSPSQPWTRSPPPAHAWSLPADVVVPAKPVTSRTLLLAHSRPWVGTWSSGFAADAHAPGASSLALSGPHPELVERLHVNDLPLLPRPRVYVPET